LIRNLKIRDLRIKIDFNLNRSKAREREAPTPARRNPDVLTEALGGAIWAREAEARAGAVNV
jgi:hypothetical protein